MTYYAIFNYSDKETRRTIDPRRLGLDPAAEYDFEELWSGEHLTLRRPAEISIPGKDVRFYAIRRR